MRNSIGREIGEVMIDMAWFYGVVAGYALSYVAPLKNWTAQWINFLVLLAALGAIGGLVFTASASSLPNDIFVQQAINSQQIANNANNIETLRKEIEYQRDQISLQRDQISEMRGIGIGIGIFLSVLQGVQILVQVKKPKVV